MAYSCQYQTNRVQFDHDFDHNSPQPSLNLREGNIIWIPLEAAVAIGYKDLAYKKCDTFN